MVLWCIITFVMQNESKFGSMLLRLLWLRILLCQLIASYGAQMAPCSVWDATSGTKQYTFEGHESPVYSVCPHHKENIQVIYLFGL
ncbi:hypothetical protein BHE74_00040557 [Ensete ventricosum]|nr:hypothetical protein GW17_00028320 [Ensete ventricosum]RWW52983.1 hypothetical protein BHE74_00040557 [Ensete ventricosum]